MNALQQIYNAVIENNRFLVMVNAKLDEVIKLGSVEIENQQPEGAESDNLKMNEG